MTESNFKNKIKAKIKWLRIQPENVKVRYVWIFAIVLFASVALLWVGLFRKYQITVKDDGKSMEIIIKEGKKIKEEIGNKIKIPDFELPKISLEVSPVISPLISPETSPEVSIEIIPEAM